MVKRRTVRRRSQRSRDERALILTYHAVENGPPPLCLDPAEFEAHADVIAGSGRTVLTVRDLAERLTAGTLDRRAVAITFDDGFSSVCESAAPILEARGLTATVFCVAGHLGDTSAWPSARQGGFHSRLASAPALAELAARGFEIGSHGFEHAPLAGASAEMLQQEVVDSRRLLEEATGSRVTSFAYPYGALPGQPGASLVSKTYDAACTTALRRVASGSERHALPRVDAHYVRSPDVLRRVLDGRLESYLRGRGLAVRARRALVKDYSTHPTGVLGT